MNYPLFIGGKKQLSSHFIDVTNKFSGKRIGRVAAAEREDILRAIDICERARVSMAALSVSDRVAILQKAASLLRDRRDNLSNLLCEEVGKPIRDARNEILRAIDTFELAASEIGHLSGEMVSMDRLARGREFQGMWKRFPIGPCSFIVPFNFPINLAAHKIAPAIAAGCPFILKPASFTALSGYQLGEILAESGLPEGAFSILPCHREGAELFTTDPRLKLLSFTGSPEVGWDLKSKAGKKKVVLELGGNAACLLASDCNLTDAVPRVVVGGFAQSGQSCISVQRVFVEQGIYSAFKERFVKAVLELKTGDPALESTSVGPLISEKQAIRLQSWIDQAKKGGATVLCGGQRSGSLVSPTVLENVARDLPLACEEAFGPVVLLESVNSFEEGLEKINDSKFGLQAGVFTQDLRRAFTAWERLEVGGVLVNEVPTFRLDHMPYGGVKESGLGREGVRYAMEDMTEIRMLGIRFCAKS